MPDRSMDETLDAMGESALDELAEIVRVGHSKYMAYRPEDLVALDVRGQSACTFWHMPPFRSTRHPTNGNSRRPQAVALRECRRRHPAQEDG